MFSTKPNQPTPITTSTTKTPSDTKPSTSGRPVAQSTSVQSQGLNRPCNLNTKDQEHLLLCDLN